MIACDIDGTLLDYNYNGNFAYPNLAVITTLPNRIALVTNQGGTPFGVRGLKRMDGRCFPTPSDFCIRLSALRTALRSGGVSVAAVRISLFHKRADRQAILTAANEIRSWLHECNYPDWHVYTTERARKPSPLMLLSVKASEYLGDSDEDEQAAAAAGIPFRRITRYFAAQ